MVKNQADDVAILKSIWAKNAAGTWAIHDLQGIDLKPREGFAKNLFKIRDEMVLLTNRPGPIFQNLFASFGMTEFLVRQSIVPVVAWNEGDEEIRCIGTGFFISATGYLLTAAHVLRDPIDENYSSVTPIDSKRRQLSNTLNFGVLLPVNPAMRNAPFDVPEVLRDAKFVMCPFEWTCHWGREVESPMLNKKPEFQLDLDIAVCKVREQPQIGPYQPLNIGRHNLALGNRAVAIGYGEMKNISLSSCDYEPELLVSVGSVTQIHGDNISERRNPTPGPNFEFNARIPGKMSGAPILVGEGVLTKGLVSRSWQNEEHATGCLISAIMALPLMDGKSLQDLQKAGSEGMPLVVGPGL
ncbi:MAG: trypsin-like peptidase domain-containing protein [Gammaproteobacteria bacterium]|nr:trypsin-like peptidase domain-containing protein [Gammaproteobacteria bacterium]